MPQNPLPWRWTKTRELAAELKAEGELTEVAIAAKCCTTRQRLRKWTATPEFQDRIASIIDGYRKQLRTHGIAVLENRVAKYENELRKLEEVEAERARVYGAEQFRNNIPGGGTGRVVITRYRSVAGQSGSVPITQVDVATIATKLAILRQAAQDLGQWDEKAGDGHATDKLQELVKLVMKGPRRPGRPPNGTPTPPLDPPPFNGSQHNNN